MEVQSYLKPIIAKDVKKSMHILMSGHTCKVVEVKHSKTGKHGHLKVVLTGMDVFNNNKYTNVCPGHTSLSEVVVTRKEYPVMDVHLFNLNGIDIYMADLLTSNNELINLECDADLLKTHASNLENAHDTLVVVLTAVEGGENHHVVEKIVSCKTTDF